MRLIFGVVTFLLIIVAPYWIYFPFIALGILLFPLYLEAIFFGLLVDSLYGAGARTILFGYTFGIIAALLVLAAAPLRARLRFNV